MGKIKISPFGITISDSADSTNLYLKQRKVLKKPKVSILRYVDFTKRDMPFESQLTELERSIRCGRTATAVSISCTNQYKLIKPGLQRAENGENYNGLIYSKYPFQSSEVL